MSLLTYGVGWYYSGLIGLKRAIVSFFVKGYLSPLFEHLNM